MQRTESPLCANEQDECAHAKPLRVYKIGCVLHSQKVHHLSPSSLAAMSANSKSLAEYKKKCPTFFQLTFPEVPRYFNDDVQKKLGLLRRYDTVFLVDDSSSMTIRDGPKSRWTTAGIWLGVLAEIAAIYDDDGIDVHFFHNTECARKGLKRSGVEHVFNSVQHLKSYTPTKSSIERILAVYFKNYDEHHGRVKPLNLIVVTDGAPTPSSENPRNAIDSCIRELDKRNIPTDYRQVGIMFAQVGTDKGASDLLAELDDMNKYTKKRDIVDTFKSNLSDVTSWTLDDWNFKVVKLLIGGIDKNVDETNHTPTSAVPSYGYQPPPPPNQFAGYPQPPPSHCAGYSQPTQSQYTGYQPPQAASQFAGYQSPPPSQYTGHQLPPSNQPPPPYTGPGQAFGIPGGHGANASYYNPPNPQGYRG